MRDFKFDLDIVLKNCERFGVTVDDTPGKVTINGDEFDVVEVINKLLEIKEPEKASIKIQNRPADMNYCSASILLAA